MVPQGVGPAEAPAGRLAWDRRWARKRPEHTGVRLHWSHPGVSLGRLLMCARPRQPAVADLTRCRLAERVSMAGCRRPAPHLKTNGCGAGIPTPGIVSVWAEGRDAPTVWRRIPATGALVREAGAVPALAARRRRRLRRRPRVAPAADLARARRAGRAALPRVGRRPARADVGGAPGRVAPARAAGRRTCASSGRSACSRCRPRSSTSSPPAAPTSATSSFDHLHRLQFDLETTGLDPARDRIFMIAVRDPAGATEMLEAARRRRRGRGRR